MKHLLKKERSDYQSKTNMVSNDLLEGGIQPPAYGLSLLDTSTVQPKLKVSQPGDPHEREADVLAYQVMRKIQEAGHSSETKENQPITPIYNVGSGAIINREQSNTSSGYTGVAPLLGFSNQLQQSKGKGQSLPSPVQDEMEQAFGADFSAVRVHEDNRAVQMSDSIHARAFTHGQDVYFNQGEFSPSSLRGKELLAHELVHINQQLGLNSLLLKPSEKKASNPSSKSIQSNKELVVTDLEDDLSEKYNTITNKLVPGVQLKTDMTLHLPIVGILFLTMKLQLILEEKSDGVAITVLPRLGFSIGNPVKGKGGTDAKLSYLTSYKLEVFGKNRDRALELMLLGLESEIRELEEKPPPEIVKMLIGFIIPRHFPLKLLFKITSNAWPYIADFVFGEDNLEKSLKEFSEGEYVKGLDEHRIEGNVAADIISQELILGYGDQKVIKRASGEQEAQTKDFKQLFIQLTTALGKFSEFQGRAKLFLKMPHGKEAKGERGNIYIEIQALMKILKDKTNLKDIFLNLFVITVREILIFVLQSLKDNAGENVSIEQIKDARSLLEEGAEKLEKIKEIDFDKFSESIFINSLGMSFIDLIASENLNTGVEFTASYNLSSSEWDFNFSYLDFLKFDIGLTNIQVQRKRRIFEESLKEGQEI